MTNPVTAFTGKFLQVLIDQKWEYAARVNSSDVVAIAALVEDHLVLTEQFRHPVQANVIDLPAGLVGDEADAPDEAAQSAAERELEEETGFVAKSWTEAITVPTSPGLTAETVRIFVAHDLSRTSHGGGVGQEEITVHLVRRDGLIDFFTRQQAAGKMIDPKVYVALHLLDFRPTS
ncbi:MAG: DNA mismatch repair protein MutT [Planctomyces sp.]|nr:DNA mismatch repair protein MutT [Planctomyces sp.]